MRWERSIIRVTITFLGRRHTFDYGSCGWLYVTFFVVLFGSSFVRLNLCYHTFFRSLLRRDNRLFCVVKIGDCDVRISNERSRELKFNIGNEVPERKYGSQRWGFSSSFLLVLLAAVADRAFRGRCRSR